MDEFTKTQRASWRGVEFPIAGSEYGFQQEQAQHRLLFRDNELVESLGRGNPTWRYTIPFREDITGGGWENLFTVVYPKFLVACADRSRGNLDDPIHGLQPAKCVSIRESRDVNKRDGVDVEVEFIYAPENVDDPIEQTFRLRTLEGAKAYALRFDTEVATVDFKQEQPPKPTINPLDIPALFGDQLGVAANRISAAFGDAALRVERSSDAIASLRDISLAQQLQQARRLQEALLGLGQRREERARPLTKVTTSVARTLTALASRLSMSPKELIDLNPDLTRPENRPMVPAGTVIWVFADSLNGGRL